MVILVLPYWVVFFRLKNLNTHIFCMLSFLTFAINLLGGGQESALKEEQLEFLIG